MKKELKTNYKIVISRGSRSDQPRLYPNHNPNLDL